MCVVFICLVFPFKAAAANLRGGPRGRILAAESPSYFTHTRDCRLWISGTRQMALLHGLKLNSHLKAFFYHVN